MNAAASGLAEYMSELSEEAYYAGWMDSLEYALWSAVVGGPCKYGVLDITPEHIQRLRTLSETCGGWIVCREVGEFDEEFVALPAWQALSAAHQAAKPRGPGG